MDHWAIVAGCFALVSVAISFYEILRHLTNFTKPHLQRYIIRILLMVPIYSLNAWIAMVLPSTGLYLDSLREVYESYVIYSFMKYLLNFLNYDTNLQQYISHKPGPAHIFPLCFLPRCIGGKQFLVKCKHGILQYVVVRPVTTLIAFTSELFGFYGEGNYNPLSGYLYPVLLILNNASQILAMYSLVIFYTGYQQELKPMRPLAKFFSIKLVVFFSFFQSVVISGLLEIDTVEQTMRQIFPNVLAKVSLARKMQEFLICFDMLIAALGHLYAFTYKPFEEPEYSRSWRLDDDTGMSPQAARRRAQHANNNNNHSHAYPAGQHHEDELGGRTCCAAFCSILDFSEDTSDISEHLSEIFRNIRQTFTFRPALPSIVTSQIDVTGEHIDGRRRSSDGWIEKSPPPPPAALPKQSDDNVEQSQQSSGVGSTAPDSSLNEASQSINSTMKNYQSIS